MKKLVILALIPLIFGCKAFQKEIVISKDTIQSTLDKQFPFDKSMILMRITLMEPQIYFKNTNIGINLRYWGSYLEKEIEGKIDLNGHIRYEKGAFYMDSLELVTVTMNEKEFSSDGKFQKILVNLIKNYLECFPLYRLKQTDIKQNLAKLLLKDITVEGDNLKILIGL
jgi:hypothetical protein